MGKVFRMLVLGVLWLGVASFGVCGTLGLASVLGPSSGGERFGGAMAAISGIGVVVLLLLIWLVRWLTRPDPADQPSDNA